MARFFTTAPTTRAAVVQRQQTLDAYSIVPMQLSAIHRTVLKMTQSRPPTMPTNARTGLVHSRAAAQATRATPAEVGARTARIR